MNDDFDKAYSYIRKSTKILKELNLPSLQEVTEVYEKVKNLPSRDTFKMY